MLLIKPKPTSTINHDSKEKKSRAQQAWSWSRHAREVIFRKSIKFRSKIAKRALKVNYRDEFPVKPDAHRPLKPSQKIKPSNAFLWGNHSSSHQSMHTFGNLSRTSSKSNRQKHRWCFSASWHSRRVCFRELHITKALHQAILLHWGRRPSENCQSPILRGS